MNKQIFIDGQSAITTNSKGNIVGIQFMSDDEESPVLEFSGKTNGSLVMVHNGSFDFVANKPKSRANSTLVSKAAHGRLSATRDNAVQLTLKAYNSENIDWQRAFVREAVELIAPTMDTVQMRALLLDLLLNLRNR